MSGKQINAPTEAEMNEYDEIAWAREVAARERLNSGRLTPKALENLNRNGTLRRACSKQKLKPVEEEILLIFDPENIKAVVESFTDINDMLFLYEVIDPETSGVDVKISRRQVFPANKDTSEIIDTHLREGSNILRIQKIAQYMVTPV
jgi:hypothetical protein